MFRSDVKQNKGNNLTFGVILLALEVMSIKFRLSHMCFLKRILVALFTVAAGNEARVDSVLIQPFLLYYVNHVTFVLKIIIMHYILSIRKVGRFVSTKAHLHHRIQ